jgi:hypothetical protein
VPDSADFVLYWWHKAAQLVRGGQAQRFGLITTNSLRQTLARRVVQMHLDGSARVPRAVSRVLAGNRPQGSASTPDDQTPDDAQGRSSAGTPKMAREDACAPLSLAFAIPDHPWVDTAEGAAVRIAMTVGVVGTSEGDLLEVINEADHDDGSSVVTFAPVQHGKIFADLTVGADVAGGRPLKANEGMTSMGVMLAGRGFVIEEEEAKALGAGTDHTLDVVLRPLRNGKDLLDQSRNMWVIDFTGLTVDEARSKYPALYQILLTRVKPERDGNRDKLFRERWWLFGRSRQELRAMTQDLSRYIVTVETAKHRIFEFLDTFVLPEHSLIGFGSGDAFHLGVLSSRIHTVFALVSGGTLEDRPRYNKTRCLDPFPFPLCGAGEQERIQEIAEELDAHRKRVQAQHPGLTLTGMYNVLEKLRAAEAATRPPLPEGAGTLAGGESRAAAGNHRMTDTAMPESDPRPGGSARSAATSRATSGAHDVAAQYPVVPLAPLDPPPANLSQASGLKTTALTDKERLIHDQGLVSLLKQLHDDLDAAVFAAYGWPTTLTDAEILERLVHLNAQRAEEEKRGIIHWLRPEYQHAKGASTTQDTLDLPEKKRGKGTVRGEKSEVRGAKSGAKQPWPKPLAERIRATEQVLHAAVFSNQGGGLAGDSGEPRHTGTCAAGWGEIQRLTHLRRQIRNLRASLNLLEVTNLDDAWHISCEEGLEQGRRDNLSATWRGRSRAACR